MLRAIVDAKVRREARGAEMIDLGNLLAALIVENQNKIPDALEMWGSGGSQVIGLTTHQPFLSPDVATALLENITATNGNFPANSNPFSGLRLIVVFGFDVEPYSSSHLQQLNRAGRTGLALLSLPIGQKLFEEV